MEVAKLTTKHETKKAALAESAIECLSRVGYARCNLRDIAAHAGVSLGTIHYYFKDKDELLRECVTRFKGGFVKDIEKVFMRAGGGDELPEQLAIELAKSIEEDGERHRIWYDFRSQAMFTDVFPKEVALIETELTQLLNGYFQKIGTQNLDGRLVYLQLDAIYRYWLFKSLTESGEWKSRFIADFLTIFRKMLLLSD